MVHQNSKMCIGIKKIQFCWAEVMQTGVAIKITEINHWFLLETCPAHWCYLKWDRNKQSRFQAVKNSIKV